jgi:hypothetical protein
MKKFLFLQILILSLILFSVYDCKRAYNQLIYYDSPNPTLFEVKTNKDISNKFFGIDVMKSSGKNTMGYENESISIIRLNYQKLKTNKHSFSNFNLEVYSGEYNVSGLDGVFTQQTGYDGQKLGFGVRVSSAGGLNFNWSNFRLGLGLESSINLDFGEYLNFRINAADNGIIDNGGGLLKIYLNLFPYISIPLKELTLLNLQLNMGLPGLVSPIISTQVENYVFWMSYIPGRYIAGFKFKI